MSAVLKYFIGELVHLGMVFMLKIANPKYIKAIRGKKPDKKDAKWIADIFEHDLIAGAIISEIGVDMSVFMTAKHL